MIKVAINGYGRIGRNILRAIYESNRNQKFQIVAINDLADAQINVHLTRYDSVHGRFKFDVELEENKMVIGNEKIVICSEKNPENLPWSDLEVDVVYECTGRFKTREEAGMHLKAGAKKVIISAPGTDVDATIVYGVNHHLLTKDCQIISNASCTTNCLAPMAKVLNDAIGIERGFMTTVHAYTNDQQLLDTAHKDIYRSRAAAMSMIPTKTGAAKAVGIVMPELAGKLDGLAIRVPTANVSLVDLNFVSARQTNAKEVNQLIYDATQKEMKGIIHYNDEPLVSIDFNHHPASCCFNAEQTSVNGNLVKVMAWYDNEWGFSNRMLDTAETLFKL